MKQVDIFLNTLRSWIGYSEWNGKFRKIIDLYNRTTPLPMNYRVRYTDEWCATTVSAAAIKAGVSDIVGKECSCQRFIDIFKQKKIWIEDGTVTPIKGDIILYNWDDKTQPNDGWADHIGVVESVSGGMITVIEGNNICQAVGRKRIGIGNGYIRGYARPKFDNGEISTSNQPTPTPSKLKDLGQVNVTYQVQTGGNKWWEPVINMNNYDCNGFAGAGDGTPITAIAIKVDKGSVKYRAHVLGEGWLPQVTGYNVNDFYNGYAGDGRPVDAIEVYFETPEGYAYQQARYRVSPINSRAYYDYQIDDFKDGMDGYAGEIGYAMDKVQIYVK